MMTESPDTIHGRMKEGAHLAGYSLSRSIENLRWLLEDARYKQLSAGYTDVNKFLRDTGEAFKLLDIKPEERKQIAELVKKLQPAASQRAIADMVGVDHKTIGADLVGENSPPPPEEKPENGENSPPPPAIPPDDAPGNGRRISARPAIPPDDFDIIKKQRRTNANLHISDDSYEWYTPPEYIEAAKAVMGGIDLDPATSEKANEIIAAPQYYTIDDDGLSQPWFGRVFLNPPYNMPLVQEFTGRAIKEYEEGIVDQAIVLTNNSSDTGWFHRLLKYPVCLTKGRIKFWGDGGQTLDTRQGQAFFYLGQNIEGFIEHFSRFGAVLIRYDDK